MNASILSTFSSGFLGDVCTHVCVLILYDCMFVSLNHFPQCDQITSCVIFLCWLHNVFCWWDVTLAHTHICRSNPTLSQVDIIYSHSP